MKIINTFNFLIKFLYFSKQKKEAAEYLGGNILIPGSGKKTLFYLKRFKTLFNFLAR
jgi:hypothetical protein